MEMLCTQNHSRAVNEPAATEGKLLCKLSLELTHTSQKMQRCRRPDEEILFWKICQTPSLNCFSAWI